MTAHPLWFVAEFFFAALLVALAARLLVRASDGMARLTGLGHFFVGSLFLAAATSAPEFFVDMTAVLAGAPDLAAGDLIGSSLINMSILASILILFRRYLSQPLQNPYPSAILTTLLTLIVSFSLILTPLQSGLFGVSFGSYLMIIVYLSGMHFLGTHPGKEVREAPAAFSRRKLGREVTRFLIAAAILFFASSLLVSSVTSLTHLLGWDHSFAGMTVLALTTSFPEIISSIMAARMGALNLVLGNIIGSNAFNMIIFVFMDWIWSEGSLWTHLSVKHAFSAGAVIINMFFFIAVWNLYRRKGQNWLVGGSAFILAFTVFCYAWLYHLN